MTREEMVEVSVQHMVHARLLWNHLVAAEDKIKRLEKEKEELKIANACANKKIAELQGQNSIGEMTGQFFLRIFMCPLK